MILSPNINRPINWVSPVNWLHPLNRGLQNWWLVIPGATGSRTWQDLCRRNHGTLTNMDPATDWVGQNVGCLDFDGIDDYVDLQDAGILSGNMTIAAWVRLTSTIASGFRAVCGRVLESSPFPQNWQMIYSTSVPGWGFGLKLLSGTYPYVYSAIGAATVGSWYRVVGVVETSAIRIYVNGGNMASTAIASTPETSGAMRSIIGGRWSGSSTGINWPGQISDVSISNRAWTSDEVAEDYRILQQGYPGRLNRSLLPRYLNSVAATGNRRRRTVLCGGRT